MAVLRYTIDGTTWLPFAVGSQGPQGETGPQGPVGPAGTGVTIKGSVATSTSLPAGAATGDAWITTDTGHVWTWTGSQWTDGGKITGPKGDPGEVSLALGDVRYVLAAGGTAVTPRLKGVVTLSPPSGDHGAALEVVSTSVPLRVTPKISGGAASPNTLSFDAASGTWVVAGSLKAGLNVQADSAGFTKKVTSAPTQVSDLDTVLTTKGYVDNTLPTGVVLAYAGTVASMDANLDWAVCDGRAHGSQALYDMTGSWNTPDLRSRFVVGAQSTGSIPDGLTARTRLTKSAGNSEKVVLEKQHLPKHSHTSDDSNPQTASATHSHSGTFTSDGDGGHSHSTYHSWKPFNQTADAGTGVEGTTANAPWSQTIVGSTSAEPNHDHATAVTFTDSGAHTHALQAVGGDVAHDNMPPWYALIYIIRL